MKITEIKLNTTDLMNQLKNILGEDFLLLPSKDFWGGSVMVMQKEAKGFCRTYFYHDNQDYICFDWLVVNESDRKKGIGTRLLKAHIELAKSLNIESYLWVKTGSWMHDWYRRNGYVDYKDHETEENSMWMVLKP